MASSLALPVETVQKGARHSEDHNGAADDGVGALGWACAPV